MEIDIAEIIDIRVDSRTLVKAKRIYRNRLVDFKNSENNFYEFACRSEANKNLFYEVEIDLSDGEEEPDTYCTCPQNEYDDYCKHVAACLLFLQNPYGPNSPQINKEIAKPGIDDPTQPTKLITQVYKRHYIDEWEIFSGTHYYDKIKITEQVKDNSVSILHETTEKSLKASVHDTDKKKDYEIDLKKDGYQITAVCQCGIRKGICFHTRALLYYLLSTKKNGYYLDTLRDTQAEKATLLATVGLLPDDEQVNLFDFYFEGVTLKIRGKDNSFTNLSTWKTAEFIKKNVGQKKEKPFVIPVIHTCICVLKIHKETPIIRWDVYAIKGNTDNITAILAKITDSEVIKQSLPLLSEFINTFTPQAVFDILRANNLIHSYFNIEYELRALSPDKFLFIKNVLIDRFKSNMDHLAASRIFFTAPQKNNKIKPSDLQPLQFSSDYFHVHLQVIQQGKFISLQTQIKIKEDIFPVSAFTNHAQILFIRDKIAYLPANETSWQLLMDLENKTELLFPVADAPKLYKDYLWPMRNEVSLALPEEVMPQVIVPQQTTLAVRLKEMEPNYLLFQPIIKYNDIEAALDGEEIEIFDNEKLLIVQRDNEKEIDLIQNIQSLHPNFATQDSRSSFFIPFATALTNGWFFETLQKLRANNIEVYGQKSLTKFKYNGNKPKVDIKGGSGIDWFDLTIEISYGDQVVPLKALRQAILNKNDFVQLGDGTWGILPEDWLKKFRPLFQLGTIKNDDQLQVSTLHYTLIDELHGAISEDAILAELAQKKKQLSQIDTLQEITQSKNIRASLRPYQLAGLNWFNQMHQIGWGGCLADDMGLGKTLQTLCYLQKLHDQNKKIKALIVCPTSLIYNWQAEIDKFTTGLHYIIYHGGDREFPKSKNAKWNLLITSYGTMRNDIEKFTKIMFDVTILDESQSIKNPVSQVTKAVQLIETKLRFILSGTPVQNNTFDLYAQLNFCNPGLLGNQEYFKTEYAIAIDKYGDKEKSEQLRKIVFPFILRRTKEQVAKDLPDKTETIMYCEMGSYQQKVYDAVKEDYRGKIMGKIEDVGVAKAAFLILEGLNKLRQVCDCPSLIGDVEKNRFKQSSIKLDELMREIEENISDHKMLIFSQFLGMLDLIKGKLDGDGIKYIYLDGSTPAKERKLLVDKFQTDATIQVFLISLKAGGLGLNLTAADYVYLVDPWWNPAVEDQAVDRTHRIGQSKKVFAYKMICKNTIEEKIIQLQQKKKSLAKDLITEDASFVKKLTKEDVAWLLK